MFNDKNEHIVRVIKMNSELFVITYEQNLSLYAVLREFSLKGYLIRDCNNDSINGEAVIKMNCDVYRDKKDEHLKSIFISDFIADEGYQNQGYGSILMNELIRIAETLNVEYISGELSYVDIGKDNDETDKKKINNRERLYYFYPKHGFIITEDEKICRCMRK